MGNWIEQANARVNAEMAENERIMAEYRATHAPTPSETGRLDIQIEARRWFDRTWGNTYHSVRVIVRDAETGALLLDKINPFSYGYDERYLYTAFRLMQQAGIFPDTGRRLNGFNVDEAEFLDAKRERKHNFHVTVSDGRKRDLHKGGA